MRPPRAARQHYSLLFLCATLTSFHCGPGICVRRSVLQVTFSCSLTHPWHPRRQVRKRVRKLRRTALLEREGTLRSVGREPEYADRPRVDDVLLLHSVISVPDQGLGDRSGRLRRVRREVLRKSERGEKHLFPGRQDRVVQAGDERGIWGDSLSREEERQGTRVAQKLRE